MKQWLRSQLIRLIDRRIDDFLGSERFQAIFSQKIGDFLSSDQFRAILQNQTSKLTEHEFAEFVLNEPSVVGKFFPCQTDLDYHIQEKQPLQPVAAGELPIPPVHLWEGYGASEKNEKLYLGWGTEHITNMRNVLAKDGFCFEPGQRIMELGCAAGRMLRWLVEEAAHSEIWGVDLSAEHIIWCQRYLSPPFNFATNTAFPHLPFPDNYFDLIYAGSVFTHIGELADAWLLELRRVLKAGGRAYITVHDDSTIHLLKTSHNGDRLAKDLAWHDAKTHITESNYELFYINSSPRGGHLLQVFYNTGYLQTKLSRLYTIKSVNEESYGFQTAILLQKT